MYVIYRYICMGEYIMYDACVGTFCLYPYMYTYNHVCVFDLEQKHLAVFW